MSGSTDVNAEADSPAPRGDWSGFLRHHFGPSLVWALMGIGSSHVVLAPTLGATIGYTGILVFLGVYLFKYGGWTLGIRYNFATGRNPLREYSRLPGPDNWALWFCLVEFLVLYPGITAAVGFASAALLSSFLPVSPPILYLLLMTLAVTLVLVGRYSFVEKILLAFTVVLASLIVTGAGAGFPEPETIRASLLDVSIWTRPDVLTLVVGVAGFAPIGHSSSLLLGSWSLAKNPGLNEDAGDPGTSADPTGNRARWISTGLRDFRLGYGFSLLLALCMVYLAARVLYPDPLGDDQFVVRFGSVLGESLGGWTYFLMVTGGFAALYSTVITMLDGTARVVGEILEELEVGDGSEGAEPVRRVTLGWFYVATVTPVLLVGPGVVSFVVWIAALSAIFEMIYYPANLYVANTCLPEELGPTGRANAFHAISIVFVVGAGLLAALVRLNLLP